MEELINIQNIISLATALVGSGGILYGYQERRKRKLANKKTEVEILQEFQNIYKVLLADLRKHHQYFEYCNYKKNENE